MNTGIQTGLRAGARSCRALDPAKRQLRTLYLPSLRRRPSLARPSHLAILSITPPIVPFSTSAPPQTAPMATQYVPRDGDPVLPLFSLKGKTAIVSGAAAGIGLAVADAFAESGANVAIWYNGNTKAIERAQAMAEKWGVTCTFLFLRIPSSSQ